MNAFLRKHTRVSQSSVMVPHHMTVTREIRQKLLVVKEVVLNTKDSHHQP